MYDSPLPNQEGEDGGNDVIPVDKAKDLEGDPWVITFDNLLSDEEFDDLIQLGNNEGYECSKDIGLKTADESFTAVESSGRTSANAWCDSKSKCRFEPIAKRVMDGLSTTLDIPKEHGRFSNVEI